jgi:signal transduction histidine kinase
LTRGAEAVAAGELGRRVGLDTADEFGSLARTFDRMSSELAVKDAENKAWNAELQQRVEARTRELAEVQDQLLQSRKLGAIAALAAGVAHEINNPLMGVVGLSQVLLARRDGFDPAGAKMLASIEREALRIRDIVERLGSLAHGSADDARPLVLADVVDAVAADHAAALTSARIELVRTVPDQVPAVLGNAAQLQHAIGHLVDNSVRAMPDGGRLRLTVRTVERDVVALDVEDTGRGIPPELLDRIFEPFYTSKSDWRGLGLGLAIAHRIVEAHHGRIRATSRIGAGTTMTLTFPAASRGAHLA